MSTPQIEQRANVEIYFDAAYDQQTSKSTSSLVCKGSGGRTLASKSALHSNVVSPFAAEAHAGLQAGGRDSRNHPKRNGAVTSESFDPKGKKECL